MRESARQDARLGASPTPYRVQLKTAGLGSRNALLSTARTRNVCVPRVRPVYVTGLVHEVKLPSSSRHSNPATMPLSVPANLNVILSDGVLPPFAIDLPRPSTVLLIAVSGAASTVQV